MHIEQHHQLGKDEIKRRADALANSLTEMPISGGVTISDLSTKWNGDQMDFSFRVSKGFFGANIKGEIAVSDADLALDINVPPIIYKFIDENKLEDIIKNKMTEILS
jgi:hypothetical protein